MAIIASIKDATEYRPVFWCVKNYAQSNFTEFGMQGFAWENIRSKRDQKQEHHREITRKQIKYTAKLMVKKM